MTESERVCSSALYVRFLGRETQAETLVVICRPVRRVCRLMEPRSWTITNDVRSTI